MFLESFKEEARGFISNKGRWIALFIFPILTVLIMGFEFSKEVITDIPMAVIDYDQSPFSQQLIDSFAQNETFNLVFYPESEAELENLMRNSYIRTGLIIPRNFYVDIVDLKSPSVLMVYDGSHMSITSVAKSKAMEILLTYKAGGTIKQLMSRLNISYEEAYQITQAFQFNNRMLYNPSKSFEDFLAPILMAGLVQTAIILISSVSIDHSIYTRIRKERVGYGLGKAIFYTLLGTLSLCLCVLMQVRLFDMPFAGSLIEVCILSLSFSFAVASFSILVSTVIRNRMVALIGAGLIFIPNSIMAGTTWPLISMPLGYQGFAKYIPFTHYANNLRNIYLKGFSMNQLSSDIMFMFIFGCISLFIVESVIYISSQERVEVVSDIHINTREVMTSKGKLCLDEFLNEEVALDEISYDVQKTVPFNI